MTTYGATLPDSAALLNTHSESLISFLPTLSSFIVTRVSLEREYGRKLSEVTSKARLAAISAGKEGTASSTLETAYLKVLEAADLDARTHLELAEEMQGKVVEALNMAGGRLEGVRKKHHTFASKLLAERDRAYSEQEKSKHNYFSACEQLESSRLKKSNITKDDKRALEKATKSYDLALDDMQIAKDQYLIDTDRANVAKARLYNIDLPSLHDDFQLLEGSTVSQLVWLLKRFLAIKKDALGKLGGNVVMAEQAVGSVDVEKDQQAFIDRHSKAKTTSWELPRDIEFEVCPVWHDTDSMETTPPAIVYLQNVKIRTLSRLAEISPTIESKRREIKGLRGLREAYEKDRALGDAVSVCENLLDTTRETVLKEIEQTALKAQVELINATLPNDDGASLKLHTFKSSSFVTPATCAVCESTLWGKALACKACGCAVHVKCELKVPAGCSGVAGTGLTRKQSRTSNLTPSSLSRASSVSSCPSAPSPSFASASSSTIPPPPLRPRPSEPAPEPALQSATLLFEYQAATAFELSVSEGQVVQILEDEDESGWQKVRTKDGRTGLVPSSYIQREGVELDSSAAQHEVGGGEAEGGKQVLVLYDYAAQTEEELTVSEGEYVSLTQVGMDAGEGWAEVQKDGVVGLVPMSYIEQVQ